MANLTLSATALPSAYNPSSSASSGPPLPYHRHQQQAQTASTRKRGINSIEVEADEANRKKRDKIMRLMEYGGDRSAANGRTKDGASAAAASAVAGTGGGFAPT